MLTLLTNDHHRRVGSGLPAVLGITATCPNRRPIVTNTPNLRPRCCERCVNSTSIGVIFNGACPLLDRDSTTLIASKATALRASLFHIPRIIYCCITTNQLTDFVFHRFFRAGCVSLIGLVTKHRIIRRLFNIQFSCSRVRSRLKHILGSRTCHEHVLSNCSRVVHLLKGPNTSQHATRLVCRSLGRWRFLWAIFTTFTRYLSSSFLREGVGGLSAYCRSIRGFCTVN